MVVRLGEVALDWMASGRTVRNGIVLWCRGEASDERLCDLMKLGIILEARAEGENATVLGGDAR